MKTIVIFSFPIRGHVNSLIKLSRELIKNNCNVLFYCTDEYRQGIEEIGSEYVAYHPQIVCRMRRFRESYGDFFAIVDYSTASTGLLDYYVKELQKRKIDIIIHDVMCRMGKQLGEIMNIWTVASITTFLVEPGICKIPFQSKRAIIKTIITRMPYIFKFKLVEYLSSIKYKIHRGGIFNLYYNYESPNIVYTSDKLQPEYDESKLANYRFEFVGSDIENSTEVQQKKKRKVIYISFGTVYSAGKKFIQMCIDAFAKSDFVVYISLGNLLSRNEFYSISDNIVIENYIPQVNILKEADLFITHGGMNSISEALIMGVPMILIPLAADQPIVAERLEKLGAGIHLMYNEVNISCLKRSVNKMLKLKEYREKCQLLGDELRAAGGSAKAAETICCYYSEINEEGFRFDTKR